MDNNNWDGECRCGHKHSAHKKIPYSPNYTAGGCMVSGCLCERFNMPRTDTVFLSKTMLIEKLRKLKKGDQEINHKEADKLLLEYINDEEVSEAFEDIEKWYA